MLEIVLNEKQWVEDALDASSMGNKPVQTLGRLARYYYGMGYKRREISKMLEEFMIRCDPNINIVRWQSVIDDSVKWAGREPLRQIDAISITQKELDDISKLSGAPRQRLMFTLLCLAKYGNAVNPRNNGWINLSIQDIMALANITTPVRRHSLLFNDLWRAGYIGFSNIVDNINVNVRILDESGDSAMRVDDFRNLGYQYMQHVGEGYIACQHCGLVVKRRSARQKYCKNCSADINIQKTLENKNRRIA